MDAMLPSSGMIRLRPSGKRAAPRHRQHGLACSVGEIIDLSISCLRVRCRHPVNGGVDITLIDYTRPGDLAADVVWLKPSGNFHYEAGLKFRKMSRDLTARLASIAMTHRFRRAG